MDKQPLVSVIIPVYNAEKIISYTLDSVLNQTYKNLEVIAIDDCSTDGSYDILLQYQKKDKRVKVLKNDTNKKVAETRNVGISYASGEFVAFVDSDDIWIPNKIEKQIEFMLQNDCKLTFTSVRFIDDSGNETGNAFIVPEKVNFKQLLKQNVITLSSACISAEILKRHKMHNPELHEDFILWLEILRDDIDFAYGIKDILVLYRLTTGSKSRNKFKSMKMTYKTYKLFKINFVKAHYYLACYIIRSLKKYKNTKK